MDTPSETVRTPRERLAAGEIVLFSELSRAELIAMFPRFQEIWPRVASVQVTYVDAQPAEGQEAA